jgi:hypothetical protein
VSVTTPDTGGPSSAGSTHAEEIRPKTAGRARSGYTAAISTKIATLLIPAPAPCSTLPTRSWAMLVAVPATSRPTPNINGETTSGTRGPARSHHRPPSTVANTDAAMNVTKGHA